MSTDHVETDYLIIGAGAVGLAFADTLLSETDAHITIVDRRGKPGGHWNDAYAFVTLHQPSSFYGVNSMPLGSGRRDTIGLNQGLYELASGAEVAGYFDRVMNQRLLPSGRVSYHPLSNVLEDGSIESLLSGRCTQVSVRRKTVDCTYFSPEVPATHTPHFEVGTGVRLVPPNALPGLWQSVERGAPAPRHFVVIGSGKTAMDTCVWLQQCGAPAEAIQWVVPRDSWVVNRVGHAERARVLLRGRGRPGRPAGGLRQGHFRRRSLPAPGGLRRADAHRSAAQAADVPLRHAVAGRAGGAAPHPRCRAHGSRAGAARGRDGAAAGPRAGGARDAVHRLHRFGRALQARFAGIPAAGASRRSCCARRW